MFEREFVKEDLKLHHNRKDKLSGGKFWYLLFITLLKSPIFFRIFVLRHKQWCRKRELPPIPLLNFIATARTHNGIQINTLNIGKGLKVQHGTGIVIGEGVVIGDRLTILHQVTIGNKYAGGKYPKIGNDVYIGAGAKIIGDVKIGDRARIGANAVVVKDVPAFSTAIGIPARIINNKKL